MEVTVVNVNEALYRGIMAFKESYEEGKLKPIKSRNGPVLKWPTPYLTHYKNPMERCLINKVRDCNPFFHFFEGLWMLAGREDVAFLEQFVPRIADYSDNGRTFNGAYGHRLRGWSLTDQLDKAIHVLAHEPETRRVVLQIWQVSDLGKKSKDLPCNTQLYVWVENKRLHMTICNRSNDMLWGAYGANAVHFSMIQEFIASCIGFPVGSMYQFSNNMHVYLETGPWEKLIKFPNSFIDPYAEKVRPCRMNKDLSDRHKFKRHFMYDLQTFFKNMPNNGLRKFDRNNYATPYFRDVVIPMTDVWILYKQNARLETYDKLVEIGATDWQLACREFIEMRWVR